MNIEIGDLLTIDDKKYLTLGKIVFMGNDYIFTNEIINDEPTKQYFIFKKTDDEVEEITDKKSLEILLPMFNKDLQKLLKENKYEI